MVRTPTACRARGADGDRGPSRPKVELRRLRIRQAAGRHFADIVIARPAGGRGRPGARGRGRGRGGGGGRPARDGRRVHVEPAGGGEGAHRAGARGGAPRPGGARGAQRGRPRGWPTTRRSRSTSSFRASCRSSGRTRSRRPSRRRSSPTPPDVDSVQTHLEPLAEPAAAAAVDRGPRGELDPRDRRRGDRGGADRAPVPQERRGPGGVSDARARPVTNARRGTCPGERRGGENPDRDIPESGT